MKLKINGIEIEFNPLTENAESKAICDNCMPILRETSPNALREKALKFKPIDINKELFNET